MKKEPKANPVSQPLDKLMHDIERTSNLETRLSRAAVDEIFLALRRDIPYSTQIITGTLASKLLADSSHITTDLTLNTVVVNLGKALFNPDQTDDLEQLVNNYFEARKETEKQYSLAISEGLLQAYSLKDFAERAHPALQQLTHALVEKLINEKQSRKIPGYKPESILEIISPILHHRIHPEIERIKMGQPQIFRQWLNTIAHEGYEKVSDEKVLTIIHNEKETAFKAFRKALNSRFPSAEALEKYLGTLRFLQNDRSNRHEMLNTLLNDFLKSDMGILAQELRDRSHDRLRRLFNVADKNTAIYRSEGKIEAAHEQVFREMRDEVSILKKVVIALDTLKKNYSKNFLQAVAGAKNLNLVKETELNVLLGAAIVKNDPQTQKTQTLRVGGYPQRSLAEILTTLVTQLENISASLSGLFAEKLKQEIAYAVSDLRAANAQLKVVPLVPSEKAPAATAAAAAAASTDHEVIPFPVAEEPKPKAEAIQTPAQEPELEIEEQQPQVAEAAPRAAAAPAAELQAPQIQEEEVAAAPAEEPSPSTPELQVEETASEDFESFTLEPAKPLAPEVAETTFESELEDFKLEPPAIAKPEELKPAELKLEEPELEELKLEELKPEEPKHEEPKPLLIIEDFDEQTVPEIAEQAMPKPESPIPESPRVESKAPPLLDIGLSEAGSLEAGMLIMTNYQLGEFEKPIQAAWEKMAATASPENGLDDNEVRLYVICDLAQQVEAVPEAGLSDVNKEILRSVKDLLLIALKDPTSEDNWSFFEGPHRDQIDNAIADLKAGA